MLLFFFHWVSLGFLHCSWHVFWLFSFLVLFIFTGGLQKTKFLATIPRVGMLPSASIPNCTEVKTDNCEEESTIDPTPSQAGKGGLTSSGQRTRRVLGFNTPKPVRSWTSMLRMISWLLELSQRPCSLEFDHPDPCEVIRRMLAGAVLHKEWHMHTLNQSNSCT